MTYATVNIDSIFGTDDYADFLADQAATIAAEFDADSDYEYDDSPDPVAPAKAPLWSSMLAAADGRRGTDSVFSRQQRRDSGIQRTA